MSRAAELQIPLDDIHDFYPALVRALAEAGEGSARIGELVRTHLRVRCVGCGEVVSGDELEELSLITPESPVAGPRIERLRLAYCIRPACNSRYYACTADSGMVAWPDVFNRTRHFIDHPPAPTADAADAPADARADGKERVAPAGPRPFKEQWRRMQFAALGAVAVCGLLFWWWWNGARIPGISPAPRPFEVISAPGSAGDPVHGAPADPARQGTNAPRAFRAQ